MIRPKKSLGQNFLIDARVARRIVETVNPQPTDTIVEIGPGTGALTRLLAEQSGHVAAVEIDARLAEELERTVKADNLSIIAADALKLDWEKLIEDTKTGLRAKGQTRLRIVANLPYYISTAIIERLLRLNREVFDMTLMLQREVADRITSGPGRKDYGYLSVMVQYYCEALRLFDVPASAFKPAPKVHSSVIRLTMRDKPVVEVDDEARFFALVRAAFAHRRKTILNNLKSAAQGIEFTQPLESALEAASIVESRRAETLTIAEFGELSKALYEK